MGRKNLPETVDNFALSPNTLGMTGTEARPSLQRHVLGEVRAEMARRDMTQGDLAKALGRSESWLSTKLSGKSPLKLREVEDIAAVLGISVQQLIPARAA